MMGLPGSGKSTWIKANRPYAQVCSADHFFMEDGEYRFDPTKLGEAQGMCLRAFTELVQDGSYDIVVDNTNTSLVELAPYVALAGAYDHKVEIVYLETTPELAAARNTHGVILSTCEKMNRNIANTLRALPPWWPWPIKIPLLTW